MILFIVNCITLLGLLGGVLYLAGVVAGSLSRFAARAGKKVTKNGHPDPDPFALREPGPVDSRTPSGAGS